MYDKVVGDYVYTNVIYETDGFLIHKVFSKRKGKGNNRYRTVNLKGDEDNHTHLNDLKVCKKCIELVQKMQVPRTKNKYIIKSCYKLSTNDDYRDKLTQLYLKKLDRQEYRNRK